VRPDHEWQSSLTLINVLVGVNPKRKKKNYYRQEIRYGAFERAIRLPAEVDAAKAAADLKNGMLKVTLPKSKASKAQQIKVAA
jgi:HSP20 family protein